MASKNKDAATEKNFEDQVPADDGAGGGACIPREFDTPNMWPSDGPWYPGLPYILRAGPHVEQWLV